MLFRIRSIRRQREGRPPQASVNPQRESRELTSEKEPSGIVGITRVDCPLFKPRAFAPGDKAAITGRFIQRTRGWKGETIAAEFALETAVHVSKGG